MSVRVVVVTPAAERVTSTAPAAAARVVLTGMVRGARGAPGTVGTEWLFASPAATWTITHNLGRRPLVQLLDTARRVLFGDVEFPDLNTVVITHAAPATGSALIS